MFVNPRGATMMAKAKLSQRFNLWIEPRLTKRAKRAAKKLDISISELMRQGLIKELDRIETGTPSPP
jgi:predicted HicB family RNase H-like nuclease